MMTLVTNGSIDIHGNIADKNKTGGWKASSFVLANETAERMAFYAISFNLVSYLFLGMNQSLPEAVIHACYWSGAAFFVTILGAFVADAYLGRLLNIAVFSCFYAVGTIMLAFSACKDGLRPPTCIKRVTCIPATDGQANFLYIALTLIALGAGGIKPCVASFGADQFDENDEKEAEKKYAFFSWFYFSINIGALFGITFIPYIQEQRGWAWGFGIPAVALLLSIITLVAGVPYYRLQKPAGSPFTRFLQVIVASIRNHFQGVRAEHESRLYEVPTLHSDIKGSRKLPQTMHYRFLDKAAVIINPKVNTQNRWRLCTITQVEEFKSLLRVFPIWLSTIALSISFAQVSTFFLSQAMITNRSLGTNFIIPTGSVPVFCQLNSLVLIPLFEIHIVPILRHRTGHKHGITSLQRMGVGLFISIFSMVSAALVEKMRREHYPKKLSMSVFWLLPQFLLMGGAELFTYVGQMEFFYDEATEGTRSISSAMFLSQIGIGSFLSSLLVVIIQETTGGEEKGWIRNDLNQSKLDNLYWILAAINVFNFLIYLWVAKGYKGRNGLINNEAGGESQVMELVVQGVKENGNVESEKSILF